MTLWLRSFVLVLAVSTVVVRFEHTKLIAEMQDWSLDLFFRSTRTVEYHFDDIEIVAITDSDYRNPSLFNSHSPLSPGHVVDVIEGTSKLSPAVIGVDLDTKDPDWYDFLSNPRSDLNFSLPKCQVEDESPGSAPNTMLAAQIPVVWAQLPVEGVTDKKLMQVYQILGGCHDHKQAFAGVPRFPLDPDGVARKYRWQFPLDTGQSNSQPDLSRTAKKSDCTTDSSTQASTICAFARVVAQKYTESLPGGVGRDYKLEKNNNEEDKILNFSGGVNFCKVDASPPQNPLSESKCNQIKSVSPKIVLIGGEFEDARDSYDTPIGRMSGVELNALAIESELHGGTITEAGSLWAFIADAAVGLLFVFIFWSADHWRYKRNLLLTVFAAIIAAVMLFVLVTTLLLKWWNRVIPAAAVFAVFVVVFVVVFAVFMWFVRPLVRRHVHKHLKAWLFVLGMVMTATIALLFSWALFYSCHVWLSVIPIFIGVNFHQFIEQIRLIWER